MRLETYLSRQKLSHAAFGELIGVSQAAVTRYANGLRIPRRAEMARIEIATKGAVKPNDFFLAKPASTPAKQGAAA